MDIVIASNNRHKVEEIKAIIGSFFDNIFTLKDLNIDVEIEENGHTFYDNALIKAQAISELTNMVALADDSGLEVDYLYGAPGIFSARYSGEKASDNDNNNLLLKNLDGVNNRTAHFTSVIVLHYPSGEIITAEGHADGVILTAPRGTNGFGYDPIFLSADYNLTFSELTSEQKNIISHRARALEIIRIKLNQNCNAN